MRRRPRKLERLNLCGQRSPASQQGAQLVSQCGHVQTGSAISTSQAGKFTVLAPFAVSAWLVHVVT